MKNEYDKAVLYKFVNAGNARILFAMSKHPRNDRYDVSGNAEAQFVDARKRVMVNLKGIRSLKKLQIEEENALASAYERLLGEVRADTVLDNELLLHVHRRIFGDLYAWAGRWRTVRISKPGAQWPPPDYLEQGMREFERHVLALHPAGRLRADEEFVKAVAHIQGEFLSIHPFREGNARTIKLFTDLLASQTGRPLLRYDMTPRGAARYIEAAKAALHTQDNTLLEAIISEALENAMSS
jgi:cell filamentation protein